MIDPDDIRPLSDFQRNAKAHIRRLKRSRRPSLLTVNGRAAVVVQDVAAYRQLLDRLSEAEQVEAINVAFRELEAGKGRPFEEWVRERRARRASGARRRKTA